MFLILNSKMPLYFKELEKAFINWYKLHYKIQSNNNPVSLIINRNMKKFAKEIYYIQY